MKEANLKDRTKRFAINIIKICRLMPRTQEAKIISYQKIRSGTSVAANYRAACRARSKAEFISKLAIIEEEADETQFWLELIKDLSILKNDKIDIMLKEINEIIAIVVASIKTVKSRL
jgi:four helix bundle protein